MLRSTPATGFSTPVLLALWLGGAGSLPTIRAQDPPEVPIKVPSEGANPRSEAADGATSRSEDLERLIRDLEQAHFPDGEPRSYEAFRMSFKLTGIQRDAASIEVVAETTFFPWQRNPEQIRPLIHTKVFEGETPVERGWDQHGGWQRQDGKTQALLGSAVRVELDAIRQEINLCTQLLRYLNPSELLRQLGEPGEITTDKVALGRGREPLHCRTVQGLLEAFPFYYRGGAEAPARLQVWVGDESGRLVAIAATPIIDGKPAQHLRERYRLSDMEAVDGVLIPRTLVLYRPRPDGTPRPDVKVEISSIELDPRLDVEDLARPK